VNREPRPTQTSLRRAETATWGPHQNSDAINRANRAESRPEARLRRWFARRSGALVGFCSVDFPSGIIINDLRVMTGSRGLWVAMPVQKQIDREGRPRREINGKSVYDPIIEFRDRATADRFSATILDLIRTAQPGVLDYELR